MFKEAAKWVCLPCFIFITLLTILTAHTQVDSFVENKTLEKLKISQVTSYVES